MSCSFVRSLCPLLLAVLLAAPGCARRKPAVVKVSCTWRGAGPQILDDLIARPMERKLVMAVGVEKITAISSVDGTDLYLTGRSRFTADEMMDNVKRVMDSAARDIPKDVRIAGVTSLKPGERIPVVVPKLVEQVRINIDADKSAAAGVLVQDIELLAARGKGDEPASADVVKRLSAIPLQIEGRQMVLGDVATVTLEKLPDAVVRDTP